MKKRSKPKRLKGLSMFANVGIAETYLKDVGVDIVVANELLPERARFYQDMYPNCEMICGDIQNAKVFRKVLRSARANGVDFLMATPPCQGMSPAGKKMQFDDRNQLITSAVDMILKLRPRFVLIENVVQQLVTQIRYKNESLLIPEYLKARLSKWYVFNDDPIIDTKYYGVPQQRKRAIFLLSRKDQGIKWEFPSRNKKLVTLRDVIGDLPSLDPIVMDVGHKKEFPQFEAKRLKGLAFSKWHVPRKHVWRNVEVMMHTPTGMSARSNPVFFPKRKDGTQVGGAPRTYMRMEWDRPAPTVTIFNHTISSFQNVHPGRPYVKDGETLYSDPRVLTIFELMRISTLPDDWPIPEWVSPRLVRQVIGEGIPPLVIKKIVAQLKRIKR